MTGSSGPTQKPGSTSRGEGLGWIGLGALALFGSVTMDRLAGQGVAPFAAPGLLPGLLGLMMMVSGAMLALRNGGPVEPATAESAASGGDRWRTWVVLALCLAFSFGLIGHGPPFWLAAALFVAISILVLDSGRTGGWTALRRVGFAAAVGLASGVVATLIFQEIFLVRLP